MKAETREIADEIKSISGINAEEMIEIGLLHPEDAKRWLVKYKYYAEYREGRTYTDIKYELSEKYGISVSTIEKLIYREARERSRNLVSGERNHKKWRKMEKKNTYERDDKGKFLPGIGGGRPKGAKNKLSKLQQAQVEDMLERLDDFLEEDLKKMKPAERIRLWADLQEFIRAKKQRVNMEIEQKDKQITKVIFEVIEPGQEPKEISE